MQVTGADLISHLTHDSIASATNQRLTKAAHDFEASMMSELLKPMQHNALATEGDEEDGDSGGALADFASESLGRALSEHGGFGIAKQILEHFKKTETGKENS